MKNCWPLVFFIVFVSSCNQEPLVLVSKDSKLMVQQWLKNEDSTLWIREFYSIPTDSMDYFLAMADGMVLCGGEDVNPIHYNKPEYDSICEGYDDFRDSIELLMIRFAMEHKVPIFGICRGHQILNVGNGGTLIPDIPTFIPSSTLTHRVKTYDAHWVNTEAQSWLKTCFGADSFRVNSRHHQSVDLVAPGFTVAAYAPDGVIESIEFSDTLKHPFAVGVQWHPEALNDSLSKQMAKHFLNKVAFAGLQ
ncbi:MAG: gamma-glutamyl-gamma-aminobutyrate hydrolase family protein [Salinivirgaceae bacterium]|nr:gamma-glutamyl-gamma-aminobutyrate hydrolase family protein [Salinivirgaceae bacterium]